MNERRANQPIREQAEKWFEALRNHLAAAGTQNDVAERLKAWPTIEHLLADCPALVPPLLTMAWQMRHQPGFSELFQTAAGKTADDTTTPLIPCKKSFDDVVLSQLHGAVRLYCLNQEQAWLAAEKARHQPGALEKIEILAPLMRRLKGRRDEDVLAHYPQRGLYMALKPHLRRPAQFGLIEALATLPTSTVSILRDFTRGLNSDSSIRNLAALETRKCKFVAELARAFAETQIEAAQAGNAGASRPPIVPTPSKENLSEIAGIALSHLTRDGLHLAKAAIVVREFARDIVVKMAVPMGYDVWRAMGDREGAMNIARCPAVLKRVLGEVTARMPRRTSEALKAIADQNIIDTAISAILNAAPHENVVRWATSSACVTAWERLSNDLKQAITQDDRAALSTEAISAYCAQLCQKFAALESGETPVFVEAPTHAAVAEGT